MPQSFGFGGDIQGAGHVHHERGRLESSPPRASDFERARRRAQLQAEEAASAEERRKKRTLSLAALESEETLMREWELERRLRFRSGLQQ